METTYEVFISDTVYGSSERRIYKSREAAEDRYGELSRTFERNGHNRVVLAERQPDGTLKYIYPVSR